MLSNRPQFIFAAWKASAAGAVLLSMVSCGVVVPKNYPSKPFVYETNISLEGNFSKDEEDDLTSQLQNQLHDSIRVRTVGKLLWETLRNPPVYDSSNAESSVNFMRALLHSMGYFRDTITFDTTLVVKENAVPPQNRVIIDFKVKPGKLYKIDSISFNITHPELQNLTLSASDQSLLKKGEAFSKYIVAAERERLVELYRDNGYLQFTSDLLIGYWDTLDVALLQPTIDINEQILLLERLQQRRENPTANIEIRFKPGYDSTKLKKYFVGTTTIYPDFSDDTSSLRSQRVTVQNGVDIVYNRYLFKPGFLAENLFFKRGDLYSQRKFQQTLNRFNILGAWKLVNIEQIPRADSDTVDFNILLNPADKYSITLNVEGSRNSGLLLSEGTLIGLGGNLQFTDRNSGKTANLATTSFRYGVELGADTQLVETRQVSLSHSIYFPRMVPNIKAVPAKFRENFRTVFSMALGNTERREFFNLTSINASWGYDFQWKNKAVSIKIPNIEFAYLNARQRLEDIFLTSPIFRSVFNEGFVFSLQGSFQVLGGKQRASHVFRTSFEESGLVIGMIDLKTFDDLFRFVKLDGEFIKNFEIGKKEIVLRAYSGIGVPMKTNTKRDSLNLPFFKQFYAGGPNSMRAWGLRLLGPGSTVKYRAEAPLRFGDFQFETNAELRFPLTTIAGFRVNGALFTDVGNVWFISKENDFYPEGHLSSFSKFFKDLAVGSGVGFRINFEFLIIRLDYGLKIKNPSPEPVNAAGQNKWFYDFKPFGGILQLGINYPFRF